MSKIAPVMMVVLLIAVLAVLLVGVFAMARGGVFNAKYANKLMRARVALQALAIVVLGIIWLAMRA
ncbi:MAG TPA: twin transmembrane helix small protein [Alphaproteobacteria bacterium]|nr:twin transmembrane helix small protein [Alphaproteobacteria bacterium]